MGERLVWFLRERKSLVRDAFACGVKGETAADRESGRGRGTDLIACPRLPDSVVSLSVLSLGVSFRPSSIGVGLRSIHIVVYRAARLSFAL